VDILSGKPLVLTVLFLYLIITANGCSIWYVRDC